MEEPKGDGHSTESSAVISFWKQFDLDGKRTSWDKTCTEMREQKTTSIVGRKRLNDLTKAFRAKSKEDQLIGTAELLKAYQEEIDQLSRRSKFSEAAFFGIYKVLYDAPNPVPTMEQLFSNAASGSTHALEIERLQAELSHYDEEFRRLKNQDITIRRLEDQLQEFKDSTEEQVAAEVERRQAALQARCDERVQEAHENQLSAEKRLQAAVDSAKQSQYMVDRAHEQLFEASSKYEERISRLVSENTLLAESTQRLQLALAEAEAQVQAQTRLATLSSAGGLSGSASSSSLAAAGGAVTQTQPVQAYEHLVTQLTEQVRVLENAMRGEKTTHEKDMRDVQQALAAAQQQVLQAHKEAAQRVSREDYEQLQRQVRLLRKVAFQKVGEDEDDEEADCKARGGGAGSGSGGSHGVSPVYKAQERGGRPLSDGLSTAPECTQEDTQSLEDLLAQRLQSLDGELSRCRLALTESRQQEAALRVAVDGLRGSLEASQATVKQLEQDLEQRTSALEGLLHAPVHANPMQDLVNVLDPSSSASSGPSRSSEGAGGASQLVPWLQAQRDKYKQQLAGMEHTCHRTQQQLEALQQRYLALEHDNVHLYSRIKYLQSTARRGAGERWRDEEEGREGEVERKYEGLYESRMNPFTEFSMIEKQRKLRELSVADRIVLNTTMAIISNHTGRNFLLLYLGAMHLLVFVTIYYSAHTVHHGCDPALDHAHAHAQSVI